MTGIIIGLAIGLIGAINPIETDIKEVGILYNYSSDGYLDDICLYAYTGDEGWIYSNYINGPAYWFDMSSDPYGYGIGVEF